jgi:hypothetical protein
MTRRASSLSRFDSFDFFFKITYALPLILWPLAQPFLDDSNIDNFGLIFAILLFILAFGSSIFSFIRSYEWGGAQSVLGVGISFFGFGLLMWALGQLSLILDSIWFTEKPLEIYDYFFVFIDPFYLTGCIYLATSLGIIKKFTNNLYLLLIPIFIVLLNYIFITKINSMNILQPFEMLDINFVFIMGSIFLSSFVVSILIISGNKIGGKFRTSLLLILFGLLFQYVGDNLYDVIESMQQNGSFADFMFYLSIYFICLGIISLNPRSLK